MDTVWLTGARLLAEGAPRQGAVACSRGRITSVRGEAAPRARRIRLSGLFLAPGFIDLHTWGEPALLSRELPRSGTTAFLTTVGPEPPSRLRAHLRQGASGASAGATWLGWHFEGPFLNPRRGGALRRSAMRRPSRSELERLPRADGARVRLMTLAPELPGARGAIRWCARQGIVVSLGHTDAGYRVAMRAVAAGARAVTHIWNGMRPLHHREPGLIGAALTEPRLTAMVIADGVHVSAPALQLLLRAKGPSGVALVTDAVAHEARAWGLRKRRGAYYTRAGTLAGSALTMIDAVRNLTRWGVASLAEAAAMASRVPAELLGDRSRGRLQPGARADLVAFDRAFRVRAVWVGGRLVYDAL